MLEGLVMHSQTLSNCLEYDPGQEMLYSERFIALLSFQNSRKFFFLGEIYWEYIYTLEDFHAGLY